MDNNDLYLDIKIIEFQPMHGKRPMAVKKWRKGRNKPVKYRALKIDENLTKYCRKIHVGLTISDSIDYMPTSCVNNLDLTEWAGATFVSSFDADNKTIVVTRPYLFSIGCMGEISVDGMNIEDIIEGLRPIYTLEEVKTFVQGTNILAKFLDEKQRENTWNEMEESITEAASVEFLK